MAAGAWGLVRADLKTVVIHRSSVTPRLWINSKRKAAGRWHVAKQDIHDRVLPSLPTESSEDDGRVWRSLQGIHRDRATRQYERNDWLLRGNRSGHQLGLLPWQPDGCAVVTFAASVVRVIVCDFLADYKHNNISIL
jgi:hypothetical protein